MKKPICIIIVSILVVFVFSSCQGSLPGADAWKKGVLTVSFDLSGSKDARAITDDFSQVASGKVFLKQGGVTKKQADLIINVSAKTGTGTLTDIIVGDYTLLLELYDTAPKLLYDANSTVTIAAGDNGTKTMELSKYIATVTLTGTWTETIDDLLIATAELKQGGTRIYGTALSLNSGGKTVSGSIPNVYPGSYDLYVAVTGDGGILKFDKTQAVTVVRNTNNYPIILDVKTGSIAISVTGDATAPAITNGPTCSVSGTTATITWTTDEPATSLVCYSATAGFDYRSSLNWAPLGGDLTADTTSHSVIIEGLIDGMAYYYVVCSMDLAGNTKLSDEATLLVFQFSLSKVVAGGSLHSIVVKANGTLWTSGYNTRGQLGDGTNSGKSTPQQVLQDVKMVSAGSEFSLALKEDGTLWVFGGNDFGQLGDNTTTDTNIPKQVMGDVRHISAGAYYSLVVKTDNTLWSFGRNDHGQLGNGTFIDRHTPFQIMTDVVLAEAGVDHSLVLKTDSSIWAFGSNGYGQLGNNATGTSAIPVQININGVVALDAGGGCPTSDGFSFLLKNDGSLWAFGCNSDGQLGLGHADSNPHVIPILIMTGVQSMSAGGYQSLVLKTDGTLWTFGRNFTDGQLGDGTTTSRSTPQQVVSGIQAIGTGGSHSMVQKTDGSFWGFGRNTEGQLGNGTYTSSPTPQQILIP